MQTYYVYVLYSLKDGGIYIGQTGDLFSRYREHQRGKVKSTRSRRPLVLVHWEEVNSREAALEKEREWKTSAGRRKIKRLISELNE